MEHKIQILFATLLCAFIGFAEDDDLLDVVPAAPTNAPTNKIFTALPLCKRIEGRAFVRKPGGDWEDAEEGRYYPFGSSFRAGTKGILDLSFGTNSKVTISDGSEFETRAQKVGLATRTIALVSGGLELRLADNLPEGAFFVALPGFMIKNPAGASKILCEDVNDGSLITVLCQSGALGVEGRHFSIPQMHAADEIKVRMSKDQLTTILYGTCGDYVVQLDQGINIREEFNEEGRIDHITEKKTLEWHLTPSTKVIINRSVPSIGERMSVHTMTFDAAGERKNECSFCEGRAEVNSGELVPREKAEGEELAKRAAEVTAEKPASADSEKNSEGSEENTNEE